MPLQPGIQIVGRFEIIAPLGAGSMGEVYHAHDLKLRRDVALKLLSPALATSEEHLLRFEREAVGGDGSHTRRVRRPVLSALFRTIFFRSRFFSCRIITT